MIHYEKSIYFRNGNDKTWKTSRNWKGPCYQCDIGRYKESEIDVHNINATYVLNAFAIDEEQLHIVPIINSAHGIPDVSSLSIESACSGGSAAFRQAYIALSSGYYNVALAAGYEKLTMNKSP
ncbi:MAG: hypothetical protein QXV17_09400 [Candidatus Micrarchaeaceae archaeon]